MTIQFSRDFNKSLKKLKRSDVKIYNRVTKNIEYFIHNPKHPSLRLHKLAGNLKNYYSLSVTQNLRIIFTFPDEDEVLFAKIGTHDEVYEHN